MDEEHFAEVGLRLTPVFREVTSEANHIYPRILLQNSSGMSALPPSIRIQFESRRRDRSLLLSLEDRIRPT